jgi:hypothetical protein
MMQCLSTHDRKPANQTAKHAQHTVHAANRIGQLGLETVVRVG